MNELKQISDLILTTSPSVVFTAIMVFMGYGLKKAPIVKDWWIPFILPLVGAIFFPFVAEWSPRVAAAKHPYMQLALYGAALGAIGVWGNQAYRQFLGRNEPTDKEPQNKPIEPPKT